MSDMDARVREAFQRYLAAWENNEPVGEQAFAGLDEREREDLRDLIAAFAAGGAVACSTAPSEGFIEEMRSLLREWGPHPVEVVDTGLFAASAGETTPAEANLFGIQLKARRRQLRLSFAQVAQSVGCTDDLLVNLEAGQEPPTAVPVATMERLAQTIQTPFETLLSWIQATVAPRPAVRPVGLARSTRPHRDFRKEYDQLLDRLPAEEQPKER
jgi:transcriptional regulator with XRE-family HTH domain